MIKLSSPRAYNGIKPVFSHTDRPLRTTPPEEPIELPVDEFSPPYEPLDLPVECEFCPVREHCRDIGYPDAACKRGFRRLVESGGHVVPASR